MLELVRVAKRNRVAVIFDNDDDVRAIPKNNAAHRKYGGFAGEQALRGMQTVVQASELAIATCPTIAQRFREYGAEHVQVIENYVPDAALDVVPRRDDGGETVVAGWMAGSEHHLDVEQLPLRELIGRALDAHPQLVFESVGTGLGLRHERYRHISHVDFFELPQKLAEWDVGIAPIADIPFNHGRSNIKVKEYAAQGRPWLASPVGPYADLGEKQGGRLVADDDWTQALGRLAAKPRERRKLAKRARTWGRAQAISANVGLWERALAEAVTRTGRTPRPPGPPRPVSVTTHVR